MGENRKNRRRLKIVLLSLLAVVAFALAATVAIALPILTHQSAGGSGQEVPEGFVSETTAQGEDGRTRTLTVETTSGEPANLAQLSPGDTLVVKGTGYDTSIGIYVAICRIPSLPDEKPSPCLGGLPEGAMEGGAVGMAGPSLWITDNWAWGNFATKGYDDSQTGSFVAELIVPESAQEGLDCTKSLCAVTTKADHTALSDRVQDMQLPVAFVR